MKIVSRVLGLVGVLALGLGAAACSSGLNVPASEVGTAQPTGPHPSASTVVVVLENFSFNPSVITIKAGRTVEWIWRDLGNPNNVTFASFRSPTQTSGVYYHTFTKPGTYQYSSTLDYNMTGEVIVTAG